MTQLSDPARYSFSTDEETYQGDFATAEEAHNEAASHVGVGARFWVGEQTKPRPEDYWRADDWLERLCDQDEFSAEWADDWDQSTPTQQEELNREVRAVLAAWLDRHNLRPKFFNIIRPRKFFVASEVSDGVYEIEAV